MFNKLWQRSLVFALVVLALFFGWVWFTAPPDPIYKGKHFSKYLYDLQGPTPNIEASTRASEAIREKGSEAAPLLAVWLQTEHLPLLLRLQDLLRKYRFKTTILPADRQQVAFETLKVVPLLAATRAIQAYLLTGKGPTIRQRAAVLFMFRFNSAPPE